jgi:hypothetical protein
MALSRLAREFAAEIKQHDWSDAPYRMDRAGHDRAMDSNRGSSVLTKEETDRVRTNAMWVVAQVLGYADPNFDPYEFAEACGVRTTTRRGARDNYVRYGLRYDDETMQYMRPGTFAYDQPVS